MTLSLLFLHAASTLFMTGLMWFVQVVHYPLFAAVGAEAAPSYAARHQQRTTRVVAPVMLTEAATALLLALRLPAGDLGSLAWLGLGLLLLIWLSTAFLQVPLHRRLLSVADAEVVRRLVRGNWIRTIAWTLRSLIALWLLRFVPAT